MVTETKTEEKTAQPTESALEQAVSSEKSETSLETKTETPTDEADNAESEGEAERDKKAQPESSKLDPELDGLLKNPKVKSLLQSATDKAVNQYRETREADTRLMRSQATKIKELTLAQKESKLTKDMQAVLAGDEEEGFAPDKLEAKKKGFEAIKAQILEYNEKVAEVEEVAELATTISKQLDSGAIARFNLNDVNPVVRAKGMLEAIGIVDQYMAEREAFNAIIEEIPLLRNGSEVRKQMDSFIEAYMELPQGKSRDLLIEKIKRELGVSLKHKPPTPSVDSGGKGHKVTLTELQEVTADVAKAKVDSGEWVLPRGMTI